MSLEKRFMCSILSKTYLYEKEDVQNDLNKGCISSDILVNSSPLFKNYFFEQANKDLIKFLILDLKADEIIIIYFHLTFQNRKKFVESLKNIKFLKDINKHLIDIIFTPNIVPENLSTNLFKQKTKLSHEVISNKDIIITYNDFTLIGVIPIINILLSSKEDSLLEVVNNNTIQKKSHSFKEPIHSKLIGEFTSGVEIIPVIDDSERVLGVIRATDLISYINEEWEEDISLISGIETTYDSGYIMDTVWKRTMCLVANMIAGIALASVSNYSSVQFGKLPQLASLIPIVTGLSGAFGTQTISRNLRYPQTISARELFIGLLIGLVVSTFVFIVSYLVSKNLLIPNILFLATLTNFTISSILGTIMPILSEKAGFDPSLLSGPLLSATMDVIGFITIVLLNEIFN